MAVLARVELDEVGAASRDVLDEHGDREHRVGNVEHALRAARALLREDEAGEVGAGLHGDRDVLLARQPADLHERAREQLAQLRRRVLRAHQRVPTSTASAPASSAAAPCARDSIPRLGDRRRGRAARARRGRAARAGRSRTSTRSRALIADHRRVERDRALELLRVVRLDERVEPELGRVRHAARGRASSSRSRSSSSAASAPASFSLQELQLLA